MNALANRVLSLSALIAVISMNVCQLLVTNLHFAPIFLVHINVNVNLDILAMESIVMMSMNVITVHVKMLNALITMDLLFALALQVVTVIWVV